MPIAIGDSIRFSIRGTLFGQKTISSFDYLVTVGGGIVDVVLACNTMAGEFITDPLSPYTHFLDCVSPQWVATEVRCQVLAPIRYAAGGVISADPGTNANATTSPNQAAVITKGGERAGRSFIGSLHVPGLASGNMAAGILTAPFRTAMGLLAGDMLNTLAFPLAGYTVRPVIFKKSNPFSSPWLTRTIVQDTARVMRRRTVGLGE